MEIQRDDISHGETAFVTLEDGQHFTCCKEDHENVYQKVWDRDVSDHQESACNVLTGEVLRVMNDTLVLVVDVSMRVRRAAT